MAARLSSEERKLEILDAVTRLFSERGFHATTTRHLAEVAGVSEALLFKYFPSKEKLYSAMLKRVCSHCEQDRERFKNLPPSTASLTILVHHMMKNLVEGRKIDGVRSPMQVKHSRLMLHSLL